MKQWQKIAIFIFILVQIVGLVSQAAKTDFFEQRYRGWLWFEEKPEEELSAEEKIDHQRDLSHIPTKEELKQARLENEQFKEELEDLRHMMVRYPSNLNYIRLYKEKEKQMLDGAMLLATNFGMVNFLNPDIPDQLTTPQNIYGRNVAKDQKKITDKQIIRSLVGKIELFVFRKDNCDHCILLEKHLKTFADRYGFEVEAISKDQSDSYHFKTHHNQNLINQLDLKVMPTVIAVTKDSAIRFELARGAVSITDLEEKVLLLAEFLEKQSMYKNQQIQQVQYVGSKLKEQSAIEK